SYGSYGPYRSSYSYSVNVGYGASGHGGYGYGGYGGGPYGYGGGYGSYGPYGHGYGYGYASSYGYDYPRAVGYTFGRPLRVDRPYAADLTRYGPGFRGRTYASHAFVADGDRSWLAVDPGYGGYNVERYPTWRVALEDALDQSAHAPEESKALELPPGWKLEGADEDLDNEAAGGPVARGDLSTRDALEQTLRAIREGRTPSGKRGYLRYPNGSVVGSSGDEAEGTPPSDAANSNDGSVARAGAESEA
ncbi:MAG: hypothetical protein V3T24_08410, partial [Longimicrobiales bacterium]